MDKKNCEDMAVAAYHSKMDDFIKAHVQPPTSFEIRQRHQEFAFECVDLYRKAANSSDSMNTWKLESDLKYLYASYVSANKLTRQLASLQELGQDGQAARVA